MPKPTGINVPIGPAIVEYGEGVDKSVFDITKGGIVFTATTVKQDTTVEQEGDSPVKSILIGITARVVVAFALHDIKLLSTVMPGSALVTANDNQKLNVHSAARHDLLAGAKQLVVTPTDPGSTEDDW